MKFETAVALVSNIIDGINKYHIVSFDEDFTHDNHVGFWTKNNQNIVYRCIATFINDRVGSIIRAKTKSTKSMSWELGGAPVRGCVSIWRNPDVIIKEKIIYVKQK